MTDTIKWLFYNVEVTYVNSEKYMHFQLVLVSYNEMPFWPAMSWTMSIHMEYKNNHGFEAFT